MLRPSPQVVRALAVMTRQYPEVLEFVADWRMHELETLPLALQNSAVAQGRCQVLNELYKLVKESPDFAAKPNGGTPRNSTHTDRSV
jgi:hypothetical protein